MKTMLRPFWVTFCFAAVAVAAFSSAGMPVRCEAREAAYGFPVRIVSPDTAQTWVVGGVTTHYKLFWDDRKGELLALLTFSNSPRVDRWERRSEQQFNFRLPGVWLDESSQTLYARAGAGNSGSKGGSGRAVPVATLRGGGFLTERVRPAPGTLIRVSINGQGLVRVTLNAGERPLRVPAADEDDQTVSHWEIDGAVRPF